MDRGTTMTEGAQQQEPNFDVVSSSVPEPVVSDHNLVAVYGDAAGAGTVVRNRERIEPADGALGFVVPGPAPDRPSELAHTTGLDPEHGTGMAGRAVMRGAVPGAAVGAVVVASILLLLDGWSGVVVGAAVGGALFGAVAGGSMSFTRGVGGGGVGGGDAPRDSFVDDDATAAAFPSIHSDEPGRISEALSDAGQGDTTSLYTVHRDGRVDRSGR